MNQRYWLFFLFFFYAFPSSADSIKGRIIEAATGQPAVGVTVVLSNAKFYDVPEGTYQLKISYVSFKTISHEVRVTGDQSATVEISLESENACELTEVAMTAKRDGTSDRTARDFERPAPQVTNMVLSRTIELSPDLTAPTSFSACRAFLSSAIPTATGSLPFCAAWTNATTTRWSMA